MSAEKPTAEEVNAAIAAVDDPATRAALQAVALFAGGLSVTLGESITKAIAGHMPGAGHMPNCPCMVCRGTR